MEKEHEIFNTLWNDYIKLNPDYAWSEEEKETAFNFYIIGKQKGRTETDFKYSREEIIIALKNLLEFVKNTYEYSNDGSIAIAEEIYDYAKKYYMPKFSIISHNTETK